MARVSPEPRGPVPLLPVLTPRLGGSPQHPHSLENRLSLCQELAAERKLTIWPELGELPQENILLSVNSSLVNKKPKGKRCTLHQEKDKADAHHEQGAQRDSYTISEVGQWGLGGWGGRWHGGEAEERVHSVGHRRLNHTASELMHHSKENQGPPSVPLPTSHEVGAPLHRVLCPVSQGGVAGGSRGPGSSPFSISPFLLCRLACAGSRDSHRDAQDLWVWVAAAGQQGQVRGGGGEAAPIPCFTGGAHCRGQSPGPCGRAFPPQPRT